MKAMSRALVLGMTVSLASATVSARALKGAEDYFHAGAHLYVGGRHQEASVEIEEGLRHWPDDPALRALANHLEDMKDQQRRGDDGQEGEGEPGDQDPRRGDDSGERDPDDGEGSPDDSDDRDQPPDSEPDGQDRQRPPQEREPRAGEMSEEEARRLLDSFADDDKQQQRGQRVPLGTRPGMEQTW